MRLSEDVRNRKRVGHRDRQGVLMPVKKLLVVAGVLVCLLGRHDKVLAAADREGFGLGPSVRPAAAVDGNDVGRLAGLGLESAGRAQLRKKIAMPVSDRPGNGPRILTVFFSRVGSSKPFAGVDAVSSASLPKGNTLVVANMVHDAVGGDLFQIVTVNPYPADYDETTDVALKEQRDRARPRLATHVAHMEDYDTIFLGYPDWWGTLPMPVFSFLEEYDFSGKTIIPFCTHEGSRFGRSEDDIASACPKATLLRGLAIRGSSAIRAQKDVGGWIAELGFARAK